MSETPSESDDDALKRFIYIDQRLDAYESFFDHAWVKEVDKLTKKAPKLDALFFDLWFPWKSISRARALPHTAVQIAKGMTEEAGAVSLTNSQQLKLILYLADRMEERLTLGSSQKEEARRVMLDLYAEMLEKLEGKSVEFPTDELWSALVVEERKGSREFQIGLWASQWICYTALYHGYEDFLVRCTQVQLGDSDLQLGNYERFKEPFRVAFGDEVKAFCWTDHKIGDAREIRNAIAHNGGRMTKKLRPRTHGIRVQDDWLLIEADDVTRLFHLLKDRVAMLVERAASLPAFQ